MKKKSTEIHEYWENKVISAKNKEQDELLKFTQSLEKKISKKSEEISKVNLFNIYI